MYTVGSGLRLTKAVSMMASRIQIDWHSNISIFASERFLKSLSDEYGWIGGIDKSGKLKCVLPFAIIRKAVLRLVRFPVQTIFLEEKIEVEEEKVFLNNAVAYFRSIDVDVIIPATFNTVFRTYPKGAMVAPFGSYIIDLRQSEETLWNNIHSKHRNVIRNAKKKGVTILNGPEYLETAYGLVQESFKRSSRGIAGRLRISLRANEDAFKQQLLGLGDNMKIFVALYEGVVQGCAVIPFSDHSAYYMHGGSVPNPMTGAMNLLQWEAIQLFHRLGVGRYDFFGARLAPEKGSKLEGILKFKERFGGQYHQGYMWKIPFHALKYRLYSWTAQLRNGGDIVDQERHKLGEGDQCLS